MLYIHIITHSGSWILTRGTTLHTNYTPAYHRHEIQEKNRKRKTLPSFFLSTFLILAAIPLLQPEQASVQRLDWGGVETARQGALN